MLTVCVVFLFHTSLATSGNYCRTHHSPAGLKHTEFSVRVETSLCILHKVQPTGLRYACVFTEFYKGV